MSYIPFGNEWRKSMNRMTKNQLKKKFGIDFDMFAKKSDFVEIIRANLIVKQFNENHKVGDKLLWRAIAVPGYEPIEVTVKEKAFLNNGFPVVLFNEVDDYCSIEPQYLIPIKCLNT